MLFNDLCRVFSVRLQDGGDLFVFAQTLWQAGFKTCTSRRQFSNTLPRGKPCGELSLRNPLLTRRDGAQRPE